MKDIYLETSLAQAKIWTKAYSSSFSRSLLLFDANLRPAVYAIYAMVRVADEIVDVQWETISRRAELDRFETDVYRAIDLCYSSNPVLHAFQWAVHTYNIDRRHIELFFMSMRMDTDMIVYNEKLYRQYIEGSAEAVGLMTLHVFCRGDLVCVQDFSYGARKLGSAFQKINFLRDIYADYYSRKRMYFPNVQGLPLSLEEKKKIEESIKCDFSAAQKYVRRLPVSARYAVELAYCYYKSLLERVVMMSPEALQQRISVPKYIKVFFYMRARIRQMLRL